MADYNNIVTAPVSVQKVARLLGTSKLSVGNLCTSERINKWSKYKPIDSTYMTLWTVSDGELKPSDEWKTKLYGMDAKLSWGNITEAFASNSPWGYIRPKGGEFSPYRLGDFKNYRHDAVPPFGVAFPAEMKHQSSSEGDTELFTAILFLEDSVEGWERFHCLTFSDCFSNMIDPLSETKYYATLLMRSVTSGREKWWGVSSEQTLNSFFASGSYYKAIPVHFKYKTEGMPFVNGDMVECLMCVSTQNCGTGKDPSSSGGFFSLNDGSGTNRKTYSYEVVVSNSRFTITTVMTYVVSAGNNVEITQVRLSSERTKGDSVASISIVPYFMNKRIANSAKTLALNGGSVTFSTDDLNAMTGSEYNRKYTFPSELFGFNVTIRRDSDNTQVGYVSDGATGTTPLAPGTHNKSQDNPDYTISY